MHFAEAVQYLIGLGHETQTIKLGLRNTELLLQSLSNPEKAYPAVQIAGTNGKGSTAAVLDSICRNAHIKTGLYTSPHLTSIRERIKIDGSDVSPADFAQHTATVRDAAHQLLTTKQIEALPTFFEQLTVVALTTFRDAGIELAILETGLGGRLDSTTAAGAAIAGITPIAMDHEEYLGDTLASVASEKAAIIRNGVIAVIANQPPEALAVIRERGWLTGVVPLIAGCTTTIDQIAADGRYCVTFQTTKTKYERVWLALRGEHQIENVALAIQLAEALGEQNFKISQSAIVGGIETASHPGRLELIGRDPSFLLDGAHNPAGAQSLRSYLQKFARPPLTMIFGAMRDKRLEQMAEILFPVVDRLILTEVDNPRTASLDVLQSLAARYTSATVSQTRSCSQVLETAIQQQPHGLICVTGSLYLIGELRPLILDHFEDKPEDHDDNATAQATS